MKTIDQLKNEKDEFEIAHKRRMSEIEMRMFNISRYDLTFDEIVKTHNLIDSALVEEQRLVNEFYKNYYKQYREAIMETF